ncbi:MAG: SxtJ family membrane protein [Myxococcales bacterium]|nr:SxtJ family membrane protein [Myxococcota bacterium]MDW8282025.1 SxtJ family membrane protein [Myxococcales bacterium]
MTTGVGNSPSTEAPPPAAAERRRLRSFGLLVGAILLLWGWLRLGRSGGTALLAVGATLASLGLLWPAALRLPQRGWMALGHALGALNTQLLLWLTFWLLLVPIGLLRRALGGSPLAARRRSLPGGGFTYWNEVPPDRRGPRHYDNMF